MVSRTEARKRRGSWRTFSRVAWLARVGRHYNSARHPDGRHGAARQRHLPPYQDATKARARDEFFADVRRAVTFMAPRVQADSPFTDTNYIQKMLREADLWLTPKIVEAFLPDDFSDVDEGVRKDLIKPVKEFRQVTTEMGPGERAQTEQRDAALSPFTQIVRIAQGLVRDDWLSASTALLAEAENWAKEQDWPTRRFPKDVTQDFIGNYRLDKLVYSAERAQLALVPVGRFAPGTDGIFDLAVMPTYDSVMVVREKGRWFIHPLPKEEGRQDWSKQAFTSKSLELARLS